MKRLGMEALIAWQGVRRRPLRNLLTAVSLLVGVLSVVMIQGVGMLISQSIVRDSVLENGARTTMRVPIERTAQPEAALAAWRQLLVSGLGGADVAAVVDRPELALAVGGRPVANLNVQVVDPSLRAVRPFPVLRGSWLGPSTVAPQVVLNEAAWAAADWSQEQVVLRYAGQHVTLRVTGVVHDGGRLPSAYLDLADSGLWRDLSLTTGTAAILVRSGRDEGWLRAHIAQMAALSGRTEELGEVRRVDQIDGYLDELTATRRMFLGIALLSLIVGSLGILNVGLATLRERSDELSLRRSFGATRGTVLRIMILESQVVAIGAAAVATGIAYLAMPKLFALLGPDYVQVGGVPVEAIIVGLGASCLAALLGALAPTIRAAQTPIASIMRS